MQFFISHGIFCQIRKIPRLILFIFYLIYKFCTKDSSFYYDIKIIGKLCAGSRTTPRWGCAGGNAESGVPGDKPMDQKRSIPGVARAGQRLKLSAARRSIMRQINGHPLLSLNRCDRPGAGPARLSLRQRERERERERGHQQKADLLCGHAYGSGRLGRRQRVFAFFEPGAQASR